MKPGGLPNEASIVLCGEAGQGIQTVEIFLTRAFKLAGYHVFATKEYMSRVRGGTNSTEIRISSRRVRAAVRGIDILVPLSRGAIGHLKERISPETVIVGDKEILGPESGRVKASFVPVPLAKIAGEVGGDIYLATVAAGVVSALFEVPPAILEDYLKQRFASKGKEVVGKNIAAVREGYAIGTGLEKEGKVRAGIKKSPPAAEEILVNGAEAVGLGAIAGGCRFVSSYPMSPSTPVLVFMAGQAGKFDMIVEQAEDEIAAVNMTLGAWYAGARGMVTTSGGGFALMTEGLSLAGMIESPLVIHLAQRPAPATGLPTRTEQGDLLMALYAGHGEFPRIILAPGTVEEAFDLTRRGFDLADKYQVPVFILTDQYLVDSYYNLPAFDLSGFAVRNHFVRTKKGYLRFEITADGVSPRGIPGFGAGLVVVDSDEHDREGHITESMTVRTAMVDKRLRKGRLLEADAVPPELVGGKKYRTLVVGWGSTYSIVREALGILGRDDISFLHLKQVFPLHPSVAGFLEKAGRVVVIENNATSQLGRLLTLHTGRKPDRSILKYDGLPFFVEEVVEKLKEPAATKKGK